jgi:hypothetical protein
MAETLSPAPETESDSAAEEHGAKSRSPRSYRWLLITLAALVALLAAAVVILVRDDDETAAPPTTASTAPTTTSTTPTTAPSTTPTTAPTTVTTLPITPPDTSTAVWPVASSETRYFDPVDAARGFAVDLVGFVDPVVGEFQAGDSRSGEVEIRPVANGPVTTVFVRQLTGSDTWWVLGSATTSIRVDEPSAGAVVSSPLRVTGTSTAFEGVVTVDVRENAAQNPIGHGFVMGGSMGEMAPFDGTVEFSVPSARYGAVILYTPSMENGQVWEAAALPVEFAR